MEQDSEYLPLHRHPPHPQHKAALRHRDRARAINHPLAMTNVQLKRLSQKGFILVQKASPRRVSYALTPSGVNELAGRTFRYLKRTMKKVVDYKESILDITRDARARGFSCIAILGKSDMDFIIEYAARNTGLDFAVFKDSGEIGKDTFVFVSENYERKMIEAGQPYAPLPAEGNAVAHIYDLLSKG